MVRLLVGVFISFLFISCNNNEKLNKQFLFQSQQNVFIKGMMVSLHTKDKWGEDCELLLFNKKGNLIDKANCLSSILLPVISYKNDSTLLIIYNVPKEDEFTEQYLKYNPDTLKGIKIESKIYYNYFGNARGNDYYFDQFKINKKKNNVSFFLNGKLVKLLNTNNIFSAYGKIEFREYKNGIFIYHRLICNENTLNLYYQELIRGC